MDWTDSFRLSDPVFSQELASTGTAQDVVLIGTGGASLAAKTYASVSGGLGESQLTVLDSTSPEHLSAVVKDADSAHRHYIVASKSGGTIETLDIARTVFSRVGASERFSVVTDESPSPLRDWAREHSIMTISSDCFVPGRFSALSMLSLYPVKKMGIDLDRIWIGFRGFVAEATDRNSATSSTAHESAALLAVAASEAGSRLILTSDADSLPVLQWAEQLVSESLGKNGLGVLPVIRLDPTHGGKRPRISAQLNVADSVIGVLFDGEVADVQQLARYFMYWQTIVSLAGYLIGFNPFDQPDVERSKSNVLRILKGGGAGDTTGFNNKCVIDGSMESVAGFQSVIQELSNVTGSNDYICLLVYACPTTQLTHLLFRWVERLGQLTGRTVVFNFGPQYLHSTGQFHKGGPPNGHYLAVVVDDDVDIPVENRPYTFGELFHIQLMADVEVLGELGRPVRFIELKQPVAGNLQSMLDALDS